MGISLIFYLCCCWRDDFPLLNIPYYIYKNDRLLHPENRATGQKLGIATGLMFTLPFIAFYTANWAFSDKQYPENWAGGAAIIATNIVVAGYCYAAYIEDLDENPDHYNDESGPKMGASKQRVD